MTVRKNPQQFVLCTRPKSTEPFFGLDFFFGIFWRLSRKAGQQWQKKVQPQNSREIQTTSFNALFGKEFFRKVHLSPYAGITATYAWGNIIQETDSNQTVKYDNAAFGAGPVFVLRFEPLVYKGFSLGADASCGIIFYTEDFPAGGDFYNFMWRIGPTVAWRINNKYSINAGYRWMHVSNGQGLGKHNPYYPAQGISVNFNRYF